MEYHTYRCPHCNSVVGSSRGNPNRIGTPFYICPFCQGTYKVDFAREWINMSKTKRVFYYIEKPLAICFLLLIAISGIFGMLGMFKVDAIKFFIISACIAAFLTIIFFFVRRIIILREIKESLIRTESKKYVEILKSAGYKFYGVEGVDFGIIDDMNDELESVEEKQIVQAKDNTFSHH